MADRPLLAVLIDADNVPAKYADPILKEIATIGEPALRRVYGDWSSSRLGQWKEKVRELGLVAQQETSNTTGKNASDIGLVIDAMDILHGGKFNGFVLVSSDSDFTALANRLREAGLVVYGVGEKKAPESLRKVCNQFIFIENILEDDADAADGAKAPRADKEKPAKAAPLLLKAMDRLETDDEWIPLGRLGQEIRNAQPDFDPRSYGCSTLKKLVNALSKFELKTIDGMLKVKVANSKI